MFVLCDTCFCLNIEQHFSAVPVDTVSAEGGGPDSRGTGLEGDGENQCFS